MIATGRGICYNEIDIHILTQSKEVNMMEYRLVRSNRKTLVAEIKAGELIVRAPYWATDALINDFLQKDKEKIETYLARSQAHEKSLSGIKKMTVEEMQQLANKALEVIPQRVRYYAPLLGVHYGRITIRNQRTKWGSCSSKGNLNFNLLLMLAPPEVLDSVVVHELCHLKEMNHSETFYAEVLRVMPEYHKWNAWLKANGDSLIKQLPDL